MFLFLYVAANLDAKSVRHQDGHTTLQKYNFIYMMRKYQKVAVGRNIFHHNQKKNIFAP